MIKENKFFIMFLVIMFLAFAGWDSLKNEDYYADELPHTNQIFNFMKEDYSLITYLTVIPGYHFFITTFIKFFHMDATLANLRVVSTLIMSFIMIFLLYNLSKHNIQKTLQLYFWPSIHIFYFLVYTDVFSAFFVLTSFWYAQQRKYKMSGFVIGISLLIRQNNFLWLGFLILYLLFKELNVKEILKQYSFGGVVIQFISLMLKQGITYIISGLCFVLFVLWNGGVVLGVDKVSHPISFHFGNIWFILFSLFFLMMPIILSKIPDMFSYIKKNPKIILLLIGIIILGLGTSVNDHRYNQNTVFLKNKVLSWAYSTPFNAVLYMIPIIISVMYLIITKLEDREGWLIYPITFIYIGLSWMVEIRYYTIPFLLFTVLRPKEDKVYEMYQIIYQILLCIIMFFGILSWKIFW